MKLDWYTLFKAFHVMAAVVWVGGSLFSSILGARIARSGDARRMVGFAGDIEVIGMRLFVPASLLLILTALAMMLNGSLCWSALWVDFALVVWFGAFLLGVLFFGPEAGRLKALIEARGAEAPEVVARIRRVLLVSRLELVLLLAVVWDMVTKPSQGTGWPVVVAAVVVVAALVAVARPLLRGATPHAR